MIENSYIWDNAVIKDNSVLNRSIVAADAQIGNNVTLSPGSVIGFNVIIGDDKVIPHNVKIVETPIVTENEFGDFDDETTVKTKMNMKMEMLCRSWQLKMLNWLVKQEKDLHMSQK